jgi:DNA-binding transcriptional LysR family regulator
LVNDFAVEIEVFLELADELHFRRTAERLCMPQPRVSRVIAALERRVGATLFERTSRTVRLTPLGRQLEDQLRPAYAQLVTALEDARAAARGVTAELRVGFTVTTMCVALTHLVDAFETQHRDCQVTLLEHQPSADDWNLWAPLRRGESDVLVDWLAVDDPGLTVGPVIDYRARVLAVARGHRLAGRAAISTEELAEEQVARLPPSFPKAQYDAIIPPCTPSGRPIPRTQVVRSFHDVSYLVARGHIVHPTMAGIAAFQRDDICLVPIRDLPPMPLGLIWCTAHENARIRALAATTRLIARGGPPTGRETSHRLPQTARLARANGRPQADGDGSG